jgi:hypothetical protein
MSLPPDTPTPACLRFRQSMILDYEKWKEGTPCDLPALAEITSDERILLADEICQLATLDWRDVEALRVLATPNAISRIAKCAEEQTDGAGIEAFVDDIQRQGWTPSVERRFVEKLEAAGSMDGALDRLYQIAEQHPTTAVRQQLLRNARESGDPTVRYSMGAFRLFLAGHVESRYVFDAEHRPRLLDLNSEAPFAQEAALIWLEDKIANPKS